MRAEDVVAEAIAESAEAVECWQNTLCRKLTGRVCQELGSCDDCRRAMSRALSIGPGGPVNAPSGGPVTPALAVEAMMAGSDVLPQAGFWWGEALVRLWAWPQDGTRALMDVRECVDALLSMEA